MLLISGVVAKLISQEKRNSTYGYRTRSSETDEKNWKYAQKLSSNLLVIFSFISMLITYINENYVSNRLAYNILDVNPVILLLLMIVIVEIKLRGSRKSNG